MHRRQGQTREAQRYAALCKQLMAKRNLDQKHVAALLGLSGDYVGKLIRGDRAGIGTEFLRIACDTLNLDPAYFFDDYDGERPYTDYPSRSRSHREIEHRLRALEAARSDQLP